MNIIEYKRSLSGALEEGEWWKQFINLLQELEEEKSDAVRIEDASFDYEYGSIKGICEQTDIYIDDSEKEEIFLAGFPKRLWTVLSYELEESVPELVKTEKVTASLTGIKKVPNGILITVSWKASSNWIRKEKELI